MKAFSVQACESSEVQSSCVAEFTGSESKKSPDVSGMFFLPLPVLLVFVNLTQTWICLGKEGMRLARRQTCEAFSGSIIDV